ncbi:MAG TPA: MBL fold metallo-hydrolase [Gemmatimonadaceae bacterium]|nr:MBL fold metallo-hydrolase [Gemmatimonadaceae bacterium]
MKVLWLSLLCLLSGCSTSDAALRRPTSESSANGSHEVVVRVLDVGQGDATLIENGGSRVLIDGGPEPKRFGALLDSLRLNRSTIDAVILTHEHADHLMGLRALFESTRHITVRFFFENQDPYTAANLRHLRDSINARVGRHELVYRDTDDPCADGRPICTITMKGGAKIHIMQPMPAGAVNNPNNRSVAVKLVGPDSASFTMWFAGDAEQEEIAWFLGDAHYNVNPGMHVDVLKADHHGSCNGLTGAYLDALKPTWATASVGAVNSYHHMHEQAKAALHAHGIPWYRTDQNGTIVIRSPGTAGGKLTVTAQRGTTNMAGPSDKGSTQAECAPAP